MRRSRTGDDDAEVIRRSVRAPEEFAAIFDRHAGHIHRYLSRRLGAQVADDLVGEVFLAAFQKRGRYDTARSDARPWLYGIATNVAAEYGREQERQRRQRDAGRLGQDLEACHAERVVADVTAQALRDVLAAGLAKLAPGDRDVLLLIGAEELTYEQVAAALEIPVGTVRSRLHRARGQLREALGGTNPSRTFEETNHHG